MAVHWALDYLQVLLPSDVFNKVPQAQVDPFWAPPDADIVPVCNGQTGEVLKNIPIQKMYRVARAKFRLLLAEGMPIQVSCA